MTWDLEGFKRQCSKEDFEKGEACFKAGKVTRIHIEEGKSLKLGICTLHAPKKVQVMLIARKNGLQYTCSCPRYQNMGCCEHIPAALLACISQDKETAALRAAPEKEKEKKSAPRKPKPVESDSKAKILLRTYMGEPAERVSDSPAHLVPKIRSRSGEGYPTFGFQVGFERLYVIRDLSEFLSSVHDRRTSTYGKGLTLYHGIEQFDSRSQALIRLLMDQYPEFRSMKHTSWYGYVSYGYNSNKNEITLTGSAFDRMFELMCGETISDGYVSRTFQDCDPKVSLRLVPQEGYAELCTSISDDGDLDFFGSTDSLYAWAPGRILRCSDAFREKTYPMVSRGTQQMRLALHDLPAFCSYVLPEVENYVSIDDPGALLQEYGPDECTPCFYFDIEDDVLSLRLTFRYGDKEIRFNQSAGRTPQIKRDLRAERQALQSVLMYFTQQGKEFTLSGDDAVFDFLTEQLPRWHELGEVYVSDRLRGKRIQPKGSGVDVSLSNGMLMLEINTGGFPPEELEALYQSLLKKRRYHRLTDGRYLALDGSPCEKLAEMTHMLQLPPGQLEEGKVELPAYRGLYLDSLLSGENDMQVHRDRQFRAMVRNFKSVEESDYQVPAHLEDTLRPYQKVGFRWLKTLESCGFGGILADEMGLGKTLQVITFLMTVRREETGLPSLIVCPASLILNWADELARFAPELRPLLVMGPAAERRKLIANTGEADVWVTSYELLRQDILQYREQEFYACVLDEGQHIKNRTTLASKAVKQVSARQRFVLTGTPIENRLSELWNLFDFLMPGYLFTHGSFVEKLEKPVVKSGDEEAAAQLRRLVQPFMLRRLKCDVLKELPPKIEHIRRIPLSEEERKVYHASAAAALQSFAGGEQGKLAILAALTRLRQICCEPSLCFENYEGPTSKLDACMELCAGMAENGHQILLFSQFTSMLDLIRPRLDALKIKSFTLQGSTPKRERARLVKAFNAGEASVFLISLKAGGTGLNLTAADVVIHYDPWWNLAAQEQATDRAHRIGQQSHVQVYKLIAQNSIEERILDLQPKKAALMDTVSGDGSAAILEMSADDLLALLES